METTRERIARELEELCLEYLELIEHYSSNDDRLNRLLNAIKIKESYLKHSIDGK